MDLSKRISKDTIKLGLMSPLSGLVKLYGEEISNAGLIATAEINQRGGVLDKELELIIEDDGSMPETSVIAANKLIDDCDCKAIVGNLLSNSRIAVSNLVSEPKKIPYLNFSFYEGSISGKYFFHFAALPNQQIDKMIPYMANNFGKKMFFAGSNYEWPRGSIDAAKLTLLKIGGEIVGEEYLPIGVSIGAIEALLNQLSRSGADVFIPYFAGSDQINLLNLFAKKGLKKKIVVVMGHYDEAMVMHLKPEVREGLYSSNTYFMSLKTEANYQYLKSLKKLPGITGIWPKGNGVLTNFGEGVYLCVHAFAKAANTANSTNPEDLALALKTISLEGPQGKVIMDPKTNHASVNSYLSRCNADGTFPIIESFGLISPSIPERYKIIYAPKDETNFSSKTPTEPTKDLQNINSIFGQVFNIADLAIIATNEIGQILKMNQIASEVFGYTEEELLEQSINLLLPPNYRNKHSTSIQKFVDSDINEMRMGHRGEIQGYKKDGTIFPAEAGIAKHKINGKWILIITLKDITIKKKEEEHLLWKASHDPLTGLANRDLIQERIANALERSKSNNKNVALLFLDLDGFKLVNDTYGHSIGDLLLIKIANILLELIRPGDIVARLGGDEFVILCENVESTDSLESLAYRINAAIREPFLIESKKIIVSVSIGISLGHGGTNTAEELLMNSDSAMYASKEKGRDSWSFFSAEIYKKSKLKLEIMNGLRNCIERNELSLVFQPIVSNSSAIIQGAEALLRWNYMGQDISPGIFIPIAEETGAILPIGKWVFLNSCKTLAKWQRIFGKDTPYIFINVSTKQLNDEKIVQEFAGIIQTEGVNPQNILLEITETSLMTDVQKNIRVLNSLADIGMKVAVDDFGTGYSSLLQLLRMPVSVIKIDREFINGLDKRPEEKLIVSAIIKMAKALEKKVIAEGVENEAQHFELQNLQSDFIQGYHFYKPMDGEKFIEAISKKENLHQRTELKVFYAIYLSTASQKVTEENLNQLLQQSRKRNSSKGITGFLVYNNGYFMQLLEGREEFVKSLIETISKDSRHKNMNIIISGFAKQRLFLDWSMGFWNMENSNEEYSTFNQWKEKTTSLLETFKDARLCYAFFEALSGSYK